MGYIGCVALYLSLIPLFPALVHAPYGYTMAAPVVTFSFAALRHQQQVLKKPS